MPIIAEIGQPITFKELGLKFDITAPYSGCRLCGVVYQTEIDRAIAVIAANGIAPRGSLIQRANERRERWRELHTRRYHTDKEVELFKQSGLTFTPKAAHNLAPLGIIPLSDYDNEEVAAALLEAPRAPINDVEGGN